MKVKEDIFRYYFYFMQERMNMFWRRYDGESYPFSSDPILANNKFTNVYRATDRVSQYLIKNVIYNEENKPFDGEDILLQILVFKIFNKIETWEFIANEYGSITVSTYNPRKMSLLLSERIKGQAIFSPAYMMTGSHRDYSCFSSKHEKWLNMVYKEFIVGSRLKKIIAAKSLEEVYNTLNECAFLGGFLSYQYAIDFNYSEVIDFDENSFVKAGIGAIRGIKKCFSNLRGNDFEKAIIYTHDNMERFQQKFGYADFKNLFGRNPTLIDLQNCFCETDKYLRVKLPELKVDNVRIKQKFKESKGNYPLFFPPKWGLLIENEQYKQPCSPQNTQGLTLF